MEGANAMAPGLAQVQEDAFAMRVLPAIAAMCAPRATGAPRVSSVRAEPQRQSLKEIVQERSATVMGLAPAPVGVVNVFWVSVVNYARFLAFYGSESLPVSGLCFSFLLR